MTVGTTTFVQPAYTVQLCRACGLYFKSDIWSPTDEAAYYNAVDYTKWDASGLLPTELLVSRIVGGLPRGARILDFGCSNGRFLAALGDGYERYGVEINESASGASRERGITMISQQELEAGAHGQFHAIVLSDVFEHMRHPLALLGTLDRALAPGGILVLSSGNADAAACQRDIGGFWYFRNIEHVVMLGRAFSESIAARFDYEIAHWKTSCHYWVPPLVRIRQHAKDASYWGFRHRGPLVRALLRCVPWVRRAENWTTPPELSCTSDHVVVGFVKKGIRLG